MKRFLAAAAVGLLFVACGSAQAAQQPAGNGTTTASSGGTVVNVTLSDNMKITADKDTVPAGTVTFHVKNAGTVTHEAVLLKTDIAYDQLPADPNKAGKVVEDNGSTITHIGETDDMNGGTTKDFTVTVTPGKYVIICNQPGHYAAGMRIPFTVQ